MHIAPTATNYHFTSMLLNGGKCNLPHACRFWRCVEIEFKASFMQPEHGISPIAILKQSYDAILSSINFIITILPIPEINTK